MDSASWSCTTAVTDAGSHDSGISPQLCRLPMLWNDNLLVPESHGVSYLRHTVNRHPSSAAKAVPEAGEEEDSYQPGRYGNVLGEVETRTMELLSPFAIY